MHRYHRIVWSEGLFLTPQHFQQWDLFHEAELASRAELVRPYAWGVHALDIDREELSRGVFKIVALTGILPTGVSVRVPDVDAPPPSLTFKDTFDVRSDSLDIYVGLPSRRSGWANTQLPGDAAATSGEIRYLARSLSVPDENNGRNERPILRAEQNLRVLTSSDQRDSFDCLPVARVVRSSTGGYQLAAGHAPPLINVKASPAINAILESLLGRLVARSTELGSRFTEAGADARDITPANLRAFLHFGCVNGAIPILAHFKNTEAVHPEEIYRFLSSLAGQLSTFNARRLHPRDIPAYDHASPGEMFSALEKTVIDLLELEVSQGYIVVPLIAGGDGRLQGQIPKPSLMDTGSALILTVAAADLSEPQLISGVGRIVLASIDRIQTKINNRLPGLPLHHMAVPPPAIPRRRGTYYFQLDSRGADWEAIRASMNLAIDLPAELKTAEIELLGLEGRG